MLTNLKYTTIFTSYLFSWVPPPLLRIQLLRFSKTNKAVNELTCTSMKINVSGADVLIAKWQEIIAANSRKRTPKGAFEKDDGLVGNYELNGFPLFQSTMQLQSNNHHVFYSTRKLMRHFRRKMFFCNLIFLYIT